MDTPSNHIIDIYYNLRKADRQRCLQQPAVPVGMVREQREPRWCQVRGKVVRLVRQPERQRDLYGPLSMRGHH